MFKKLLTKIGVESIKKSIKILKKEDIKDCFANIINNRFSVGLVNTQINNGYISIVKNKGLIYDYKPFSYKEIEEDIVQALDYIEDEFNIEFFSTSGYIFINGHKSFIGETPITELDKMNVLFNNYDGYIIELKFWFKIK